ncbi:hypothetical protein K9L63_01420 [Candidatus Gracilibacteria bacterium]|nr:hypothetical protein [Candidatus Gracilibacteria bacterium]
MILSFLSLFFWSSALAATLPTANLVITPPVGEVNRSISFDASDSENTRGTRDGLEYRFQFANEGNWTSWSSLSRRTFVPENEGNFRARLQVRDRQSGTVSTTYRTYRVTGGMYRNIHISVRPTKIRAGEPAYFEIVASLPRTEDQDSLQVRWDFNSDGRWDTPWSRQRIVEHIFGNEEVGQVSPTAEVRFPDGSVEQIRGIATIPVTRTGSNRPVLQRYWQKLNIFPASILPPIVDVSPGKRGYTEETVFRFDASDSRIPANAWLEWNFYGEQFVKGKSVVSHRFGAPGLHEVRVRACYDRANPKCAETLVTVEVKENPLDYRVEIQAQNTTKNTSFSAVSENQFFSAVVGDRIRFSANIRHQGITTGGRFTYRWDFEGDGQYDTPFQTVSTVEYTFPRSGNYSPTVQVQNEDLVSVRSSVRLRVVANTAPRGSFTVDTARIHVGDKVRFFPKVQDLQTPTSRIEVRFDADGDGNWDNQFRSLTSYEWRYEEPGQYVARMEMKDENGKISSVARLVTVFGYEAPRARVVVSRRNGTTRTNFVFDASESTGQNLGYFWDFDYQGPQDLISQGQRYFTSEARIEKTFPTPGEKVISVTVRDKFGNEDRVHFSVLVSQYALQPTPILPEQNPRTENLFPQGVPVESIVPNYPLPPGSETEQNETLFRPKEVLTESPQQTLRDFYRSGGDRIGVGQMGQSTRVNVSETRIIEPDRALARADMFFFLYEHELQRPPFQLQEQESFSRTIRLGADHNILPFLTENPFSDVRENDWFYMVALLSYRDKFSQSPFFFPASEVTPAEAAQMVKIFTGRSVNFGEGVTRQEFRDALR